MSSSPSPRARLKAWKRAKWRSLFPVEGVLIQRLSVREHFWVAVLRPGAYRRWQVGRFRRWAVHPDDVFYEFTTDRYYRVHEVRAEYVVVEPLARQVVSLVERGRLRVDDPGLVRLAERVPRPLPQSWEATREVLPL